MPYGQRAIPDVLHFDELERIRQVGVTGSWGGRVIQDLRDSQGGSPGPERGCDRAGPGAGDRRVVGAGQVAVGGIEGAGDDPDVVGDGEGPRAEARDRGGGDGPARKAGVGAIQSEQHGAAGFDGGKDRHRESGGHPPAGGRQGWAGHQLAVDEPQPLGVPVLLETNLVVIRGDVSEVVGESCEADPAGPRSELPPGQVAGLRFADLAGEEIDELEEMVGRERAVPEPLVAIDPGLPKVRGLEELEPPWGFVEVVGAQVQDGRPPDGGVEIPRVARPLAPVKVPDRPEAQRLGARLMEIGAQAQRVHIERHHAVQVMIDPGGDIDVGGITEDRVGPVRPLQRCVKVIEVSSDVGELRLSQAVGHLETVRLDPVQVRPPRGELRLTVRTVDAEDVAAGDLRDVRMLRLEPVHRHPVDAPLDLLLQHEQAVVIHSGERARPAGVVLEEHLEETGP